MLLIITTIITFSATALEIQSPEQGVYTSDVPLIITSNLTMDNIIYTINSGTAVLACNNCSLFETMLALGNGDYSLRAEGSLGNETYSDLALFSIKQNFNLEVASPINTIYSDSLVELYVTASPTLDWIGYSLNGGDYNLLCSNCSGRSTYIYGEEGQNILSVIGSLDDTEREVIIPFTVVLEEEEDENEEGNEDDGGNSTEDEESGEDEQEDQEETGDAGEDGEPRCSLGCNKLPKQVENGDITDEELAGIISNYSINPGIINRLIKTGKLGNESIQAILDAQFAPPGILKKVMGFFGFRQKTQAQLIYENYNLSQQAQQQILLSDDLPDEYSSQIKQKFQAKIERMIVKNQTQKIINRTINLKKANTTFANKSSLFVASESTKSNKKVDDSDSSRGFKDVKSVTPTTTIAKKSAKSEITGKAVAPGSKPSSDKNIKSNNGNSSTAKSSKSSATSVKSSAKSNSGKSSSPSGKSSGGESGGSSGSGKSGGGSSGSGNGGGNGKK